MAKITRWVRVEKRGSKWMGELGNDPGLVGPVGRLKGGITFHIWTDLDTDNASWGEPAVAYCPIELSEEQAALLATTFAEVDLPEKDLRLGQFALQGLNPRVAGNAAFFMAAIPGIGTSLAPEKMVYKDLLCEFCLRGFDAGEADELRKTHDLPSTDTTDGIDKEIYDAGAKHDARQHKDEMDRKLRR